MDEMVNRLRQQFVLSIEFGLFGQTQVTSFARCRLSDVAEMCVMASIVVLIAIPRFYCVVYLK